MATRIGTGPTGTTRESAGPRMSEYAHDDTALQLRWAIRRADDAGDTVPCRGEQMIGPKLPIVRLLVCGGCPLYLKAACARFGIAVVLSERSRQALIAGGRYLVNVRDAEQFAADLDAGDPGTESVSQPVDSRATT